MPLQPWEQGKLESDKDFSKFVLYRNLGPSRTLSDTEFASTGKRPKASVSGSWSVLSRAMRWAERAQAWDKAQALKISAIVQSDREKAATLQEQGIALASELFVKFLTEAASMTSKDAIKRVNEIIGRGRHGDFLLNSHKALFGEKHEVKVNEDYKLLTYKKFED